ncbi:MAG: hypothetical protein F4X48_08205 [Acidimicrobiia bacterium]|nr:hypothetical protein [Acidimicrobiia bacterium]MYC58541.1 hypothetical protein [Acidimicrobiia bacterium]MYI30352.1 hypothetical protein [Acidimicrobiia bacterium]
MALVRSSAHLLIKTAAWLTIAGIITASACGSESSSNLVPSIPITTTNGSAPTPVTEMHDPSSAPNKTFLSPVFQPNGNRLAQGSGLATGFIQEVTTKDIELNGIPTWITGASTPTGDLWVIALNDGSLLSYQVPIGEQPLTATVPVDRLKAHQPPVLQVADNLVRLVTTPVNASANSIAVHLAGERTAYIDNLHRLTVLEPDGNLWRPDIEVLPDSRLVQLNKEQILVLANPTNRHPYSALGDDLEATTVVKVTVGSNEVTTIYNSGETVIESIAPLLADMDGDGTAEVALTLSDATHIWSVLVSTTGSGEIARSEPVDRLLGWRHILALGPLGPNGQIQLAEVLYPDGQGNLVFLQKQGNSLEVAASLKGYRSHEFGSRNLEQALAADLDRDGHIEVIVPTLDRQNLAAVRNTPEGATELWRRSIGGALATNIAVIERPDGTLSLAVATNQGTLRIWQ